MMKPVIPLKEIQHHTRKYPNIAQKHGFVVTGRKCGSITSAQAYSKDKEC